MSHKHSHNTGFIIAGIAALSATIGATVALLFTPRNGNEVRQGVKRRALSLKRSANSKVPELSDDISDVVDAAEDKAKRAAASTKTRTRATKTTVKRTVRKATDNK